MVSILTPTPQQHTQLSPTTTIQRNDIDEVNVSALQLSSSTSTVTANMKVMIGEESTNNCGNADLGTKSSGDAPNIFNHFIDSAHKNNVMIDINKEHLEVREDNDKKNNSETNDTVGNNKVVRTTPKTTEETHDKIDSDDFVVATTVVSSLPPDIPSPEPGAQQQQDDMHKGKVAMNSSSNNENDYCKIADITTTSNSDDNDTIQIVIASEQQHQQSISSSNAGEAAAAAAAAISSDPVRKTTATAITLQSLPLDALHNIASYLTASEWCNNFGILNKQTLVLCRIILQRVYIHAYKCLMEIIITFKYYHQYEDCIELATVYINNGIPVYPYSFGHAYHTVYWKLKIEINESAIAATSATSSSYQLNQQPQLPNRYHRPQPAPMNDTNNTNETATTAAAVNMIDPFYGIARINQRPGHSYTYLEEKCNFYATYSKRKSSNGAMSSSADLEEDDDENDIAIGAHASTAMTMTTNTTTATTIANSNLSKDQNNTIAGNKLPTVLIHQHLYDRHHIHNEYCTDQQNGTMNTPSINLSADLFYPSVAGKTNSNYHETFKNMNHLDRRHRTMNRTTTTPSSSLYNGDTTLLDINEYVSSTNRLQQQSIEGVGTVEQECSVKSSNSSMVSNCYIDTYSATSMRSDVNNQHLQEVRQHLLSRFATYQRRLESFLSRGDIYAYDECILDIWDEFFPCTRGIHYYDLETPVPRIANMYKFLTKPCPKAIGTVQCEIERIKITNRGGKGGGMKGRLFPTYEYRLFIRHRPLPTNNNNIRSNAGNNDDDDVANDLDDNNMETPNETTTPTTNNSNGSGNNIEFVRRDTVLMVAKNRGRKHTEHNGIVPLTNTSNKKGSNNYYLYMPQQMDVDEHFRTCNKDLIEDKKYAAKMEPNGVSRYPLMLSSDNDANIKSNTLLGRLQSNFIGTEFQIFIPRIQKLSSIGSRKLMEHNSSLLSPPFHSDDELDYDSGMSSDTNTNPSVRRSRFSRFRRGNATTGSASNNIPMTTPSTALSTNQFYSSNSDSGSAVSTPIYEHRTVKRTLSSPENLQSYQGQNNRSRVSRRAIANDINPQQTTPISSSSQHPSPLLLEEEAGAITYTANLLGSRPRIMDVCVPKVSPSGDVGLEWRQYLESCDDDTDDCRMLSCFRQLQHRRDNQDQHQQHVTPPQNNNINDVNNNGGHGSNNTENDGEIENHSVNVYDTDYGLLALQNRPPWWNVELGSFVLNFGGRVSVASVKNFQLCERHNQDEIMLQFGRIQGRHSFTMDFRHPLTAVQAFSIAISSLQSKISFG